MVLGLTNSEQEVLAGLLTKIIIYSKQQRGAGNMSFRHRVAEEAAEILETTIEGDVITMVTEMMDISGLLDLMIARDSEIAFYYGANSWIIKQSTRIYTGTDGTSYSHIKDLPYTWKLAAAMMMRHKP